ncbi:MAG: hypothetical protein ACLFUF_00005 [Opitutales bacterium]
MNPEPACRELAEGVEGTLPVLSLPVLFLNPELAEGSLPKWPKWPKESKGACRRAAYACRERAHRSYPPLKGGTP